MNIIDNMNPNNWDRETKKIIAGTAVIIGAIVSIKQHARQNREIDTLKEEIQVLNSQINVLERALEWADKRSDDYQNKATITHNTLEAYKHMKNSCYYTLTCASMLIKEVHESISHTLKHIEARIASKIAECKTKRSEGK